MAIFPRRFPVSVRLRTLYRIVLLMLAIAAAVGIVGTILMRPATNVPLAPVGNATAAINTSMEPLLPAVPPRTGGATVIQSSSSPSKDSQARSMSKGPDPKVKDEVAQAQTGSKTDVSGSQQPLQPAVEPPVSDPSQAGIKDISAGNDKNRDESTSASSLSKTHPSDKTSSSPSPFDTTAAGRKYAFELASNPPKRDASHPQSGFTPFMTSFRTNADKEKQSKIREMMQHAWKGYMTYASGTDELKPLSRQGHNWYTSYSMLSTPVDALDTLWIMGLTEEYNQARKMTLRQLSMDIPEYISVFETTIRILGGLLSVFDLTGDHEYLKLAVSLADRMLPAFDTPTGIPRNWLKLSSGEMKNDATSCIAEIGTLQLEFQYLSDITGNPVYQNRALAAFEKLFNTTRPIPGLFPLRVSVMDSVFSGDLRYSLAGEGDSFYEYILKMYVSTGDQRFLNRFHISARDVASHIAVETHEGKGMYIPTVDNSLRRESDNFDHLSCFAGGWYALGAVVDPQSPNARKWESIARKITWSCAEAYRLSSTGLGGETMRGETLSPTADIYKLRPEVIEAVFYMWRLTHDPQYRDYGWHMVESLEKNCRDSVGYHGILHGSPQDLQYSFFLAETLKYLYLLYSDDDAIPLEKYVFNTEAHPLSIRGHGRRWDPKKWVAMDTRG